MTRVLIASTLAAGLCLCASKSPAEEAPAATPASAGASRGETERLRQEVARLRAEVDELLRRCAELERELESRRAPTRSAVEDYLEARGITGLPLTDRDLRPLDRVLRRATLGAEIRMRYELWDNLVDLDEGSTDLVDFSETRARLVFGYALAAGPEMEIELQGLFREGGLLELPPDVFLLRPPGGWAGMDAEFALAGEKELSIRRAEVRLPAFNLLGRLAHVPVTLVVGRQELAFGSGFFLGADEEGAGVTWDAVRLCSESGEGGRVDVFAGRAGHGARALASHLAGPVDPDSDPVIEIAGVRAETSGLLPDSALAAYYVRSNVGAYFVRSASGAPEVVPPVTLNTVGVELGSNLTTRARLRLDGAVQWGEYGAEDISDCGAAAAELEVRVGATVSSVFAAYGSGDRPGTPDHEGFLPLAQDSRGRWDELGLFSSRNTWLWGAGFAWRNETGAEAGVRFAQAYAPEPGSPAGLVIRDAPGPGDRIGEVVSLFVKWRLFEEEGSYLRASYTHLAPGDYFAPSADGAGRFRLELGFGF